MNFLFHLSFFDCLIFIGLVAKGFLIFWFRKLDIVTEFSVSGYCVEHVHYWNFLNEFHMDYPNQKKRKRKTREEFVVETLAKWKEHNAAQLESCALPKVPAKGSKKGCMKGNGEPKNSQCRYRGVGQRTWGKWEAGIRKPNGGKRLWLGTFDNAVDTTSAYDEAARTMYTGSARLNFPDNIVWYC